MNLVYSNIFICILNKRCGDTSSSKNEKNPFFQNLNYCAYNKFWRKQDMFEKIRYVVIDEIRQSERTFTDGDVFSFS